MRARSRSLRFKLTIWFVLLFLALQLTFVGGVVFFRRGLIRESLDDALSEAAESLVDNITNDEAGWTVEELEGLVPARAGFRFYAVRDEHGELLVTSPGTNPGDIPWSDWEIVPTGLLGEVITPIGPQLARSLTGEEVRLRLITVPFRYKESVFFLQAAVRDDLLARLLGPFLDLVVIGVPVGVFAAMIAAWIIAGRVVSPIHRLSSAAKGVSPRTRSTRFRVLTTDQEIARLEEELNSALARLESGYDALDQFIGNVSHELKTPISVLLTEAQVAKLGDRDPARLAGFLDKSERELKRVGRIVESILILAREDLLRQTDREPVSVNDVLLEAVQNCRAYAEQRDVRIVLTLDDSDDEAADPYVEGHTGLLETLVENLLRNAISHSPEGATVELSHRVVGGVVRIRVRDSGPGIEEPYLDKVFDRFFRAPERGTRDGTGLGLSIARNVAELHRGDITVRNNEEGGCTFVVSLPAVSAEEARRSRSDAERA